MAKEKCPHCTKKKPDLSEIRIGVAGNLLSIRVCGSCRKNLEMITSYASAFPASTPVASAPAAKPARRPARGARTSPAKPKANNAKYDRFALSKEEIRQTQALRPTVRYQDSPRKRDMDNIDKVNTGERVSVFCYGSGKLSGGRNKKVLREAQGKLGTDNVKCIKDDGFEAVFEAA